MLKSAVEELAKNESKQEIMELGKDIEKTEADWKIIENLQTEILQSFRDITEEEITTLKEEEAILKEESAAVKEALNDEKVKEEEAVKEEEGVKEAAAVKEEDVIEKANLV
jgi:hypothetical protein